MKYRALVSFSGALSMYEGEVRELDNKVIIKDLLSAKYIEEVKEEPNKEEELQAEIEELKQQITEITKGPETPSEDVEPNKDVKSSESKPDNK